MRTFSLLLLALSLLALSGCAQKGVVWRVDHWDQTMTIDDETYRITDGTRFYGPDDNRIGLDDVPNAEDPRIGFRTLSKAEVQFLEVPGAEEPTLDTVWVLDN